MVYVASTGAVGHDRLVLNAKAFAAEKCRVMASGRPSSGDDLLGMEIDFDILLSDSELLTEVEVRKGDNVDEMIHATCNAAPGVTAIEVEAELRRLWIERLRYGYLEAHMVTRSTKVRLDAITQIAPGAFYVTATVTTQVGQHDRTTRCA